MKLRKILMLRWSDSDEMAFGFVAGDCAPFFLCGRGCGVVSVGSVDVFGGGNEGRGGVRGRHAMTRRMSNAEAAQRLLQLALVLMPNPNDAPDIEAILIGAKRLVKRVAERQSRYERRRGEVELKALAAIHERAELEEEVREVAGGLEEIEKLLLVSGRDGLAQLLSRCAWRLRTAAGEPKNGKGKTETAEQNGDEKGGAE